MKYFESGSNNVQCQTCKKILKRSDAKRTWQNYIVCQRCYDPKHPNDYPRQIPRDDIAVMDARPRQTTNITVSTGQHRWTDSTLIWNDATWRWDDDPSNGNIFGNGSIS